MKADRTSSVMIDLLQSAKIFGRGVSGRLTVNLRLVCLVKVAAILSSKFSSENTVG